MIHIVCVNQGDKFGPEYPERLYRGVRRHMTLPHKFVCLTDHPIDTVPCEPLPAPLVGWWSKLGMFRPGVFPEGDRVLYFDLDTIITGSLDEIAAYDGSFAMLRDFYHEDKCQSSVMAWTPHEASYLIWRQWWANECPLDERGDQGWIEKRMPEADVLQDLFPDKLVSFKVHCKRGAPDGASVVNFHGWPRPHECKGWVKEAWRGPLAVDARAKELLRWLPPGKIVGAEIGVSTGNLSSRLLARPDLHLLMVDSWEPDGAAYLFASGDLHAGLKQARQAEHRYEAEDRVAFAGGRSVIDARRSLVAVRDAMDASLDFVFIDADHSYEGCKADLEAWAPKVKPGGLLAGHDYNNPQYPEFGVAKAVDEFTTDRNLSCVLGRDCTYFIRIPGDTDA